MPGCRSEPVGGGSAALDGSRTLVMHRRVAHPAPGSDQRPLYTLAWRSADGTVEPIALETPVIHAVALGETIYFVDPQHDLYRHEDGSSSLVSEGVFARPVVDAGRVAWTDGAPGEQLLRWRAVGGPQGLVRTGLYQLGLLRFTPDGSAIVGVGSTDGGVAGVHVVPLADEPARCLTNCELRAGRPWPEGAFVPNPAAADGFSFEGSTLRWDTAAGRVRRDWSAP